MKVKSEVCAMLCFKLQKVDKVNDTFQRQHFCIFQTSKIIYGELRHYNRKTVLTIITQFYAESYSYQWKSPLLCTVIVTIKLVK